MKAFQYLLLVTILVSGGCHGKKRHSNTAPASPEEESRLKFKKIENLRFGFKAMIPADWSVADPSDNGDGFLINAGGIPADLADIRIYGSYEPLATGAISKDSIEIFSFADGEEGQAFLEGGSFTVQRLLGDDRFVIFNAKEKSRGWTESHRKILMKIAASIVPVGE